MLQMEASDKHVDSSYEYIEKLAADSRQVWPSSLVVERVSASHC
jgi:hypothetical protein